MSAFLQQAEDILGVAVVANDPGAQDVAILMDRQGGMRMLDPAGWSLPAMSAEFGATAVYKVERRGGTVRVEGWGGGQRCLIQRNAPAHSSLEQTRVEQVTGLPCLAPMPGTLFLY